MIRNIWAVGRNYAEHAKELGNTIPNAPLFFLKAGSCAVWSDEIHIPAWCEEVHHELEVILYFNQDLEIDRMGLALDLTERKKQNELKEKGSPWTLAKSFTCSCPITKAVACHLTDQNLDLQFELLVNNELKQKGDTKDMIFKARELVQYCKHHFPVVPGDALLTGTPAGVGPLKRGDKVTARLLGHFEHHWTVF